MKIRSGNSSENYLLESVNTENCVSTVSLTNTPPKPRRPKRKDGSTDQGDALKKPKKQRKKRKVKRKSAIREIRKIIQRDIENLSADVIGDTKKQNLSIRNLDKDDETAINDPIKLSMSKKNESLNKSTTDCDNNTKLTTSEKCLADDQYLKLWGDDDLAELFSKVDNALNKDCKELMPDVYRKPAFTDLYEKLVMQLEMNDSYVCFQKLMTSNKIRRTRPILGRSVFQRNRTEAKVILATDMKKKYNDSLWFSQKSLVRKSNSGHSKKIRRKVSSEKRIKTSSVGSNRSMSDNKSNSSRKSSTITLSNYSSSTKCLTNSPAKKNKKVSKNSTGSLRKMRDTRCLGKY